MSNNNEVVKELNQVIKNALSQFNKIIESEKGQEEDFLSWVNTFLVGIISKTVDLAEIHSRGKKPFIYAEIEAAARLGGLHAIQNIKHEQGAVSPMESDEMITAMNYLGQTLSTALFKGFNELPISLRHPETLLRSVEAFLANLINNKFNASHHILNDLCDHVHMALDDF